MPSTPLLHIANTAVDALSLDLRIVVVAIVAFAAVSALISLPRRHVGRRDRQRAMLFAAAVLTATAVLPSIFPYDHLFGEAPHPGSEAQAVHQSHCHATPASCADSPVASGPGQFLQSAPLLVVPSLLSVLLLFAAAPLVGITRRPPTPPPLLCPALA
ncbi:MAG: hypothetical protein WEC75_07180 [Dehalococcoidia bacterium]